MPRCPNYESEPRIFWAVACFFGHFVLEMAKAGHEAGAVHTPTEREPKAARSVPERHGSGGPRSVAVGRGCLDSTTGRALARDFFWAAPW